MRKSLLYNPLHIVERQAVASRRWRRHHRLQHTPAAHLKEGHIGSLELLELLKDEPPKVIYDIGANRGTWTCLAKAIFPAAQVEAFEPLAMHFEEFQTRTQAVAGVRLHRVALGAAAAKLEMDVMDFSDASSFLPATAATRAEFDLHSIRHENLVVFPLDPFRAQHQLPAPDLVKLDVQGYEKKILTGAGARLDQVLGVQLELSLQRLYEGQPDWVEMVQFLQQKGFTLWKMEPGTRNSETGREAEMDGIFFRTA